eukprot:6187775-Alexandrium_andersonii.AAC.1
MVAPCSPHPTVPSLLRRPLDGTSRGGRGCHSGIIWVSDRPPQRGGGSQRGPALAARALRGVRGSRWAFTVDRGSPRGVSCPSVSA